MICQKKHCLKIRTVNDNLTKKLVKLTKCKHIQNCLIMKATYPCPGCKNKKLLENDK